MKTLKLFILTLALMTIAPSAVLAGSGKAIMPHWYAYNRQSANNVQNSYIWLSNISQNDLIVKVTVYKSDGTKYTNGVTYNEFYNNTEIKAGRSAYVKIGAVKSDQSHHGYAVIEWENHTGEDNVVGLIGWGNWEQNSLYKSFSIPINNGMPF